MELDNDMELDFKFPGIGILAWSVSGGSLSMQGVSLQCIYVCQSARSNVQFLAPGRSQSSAKDRDLTSVTAALARIIVSHSSAEAGFKARCRDC